MEETHGPRILASQFFSACRIVRGPLFVAIFAFLALSMPPQIHEVYRVLAHDWRENYWQIVFAFVTLLLASAFIWHCARQVTLRRKRQALAHRSLEGFMLRWLPRVAGALVPLGAALGLASAFHAAQTTASRVTALRKTESWEELETIYGMVAFSPNRLAATALICAGLAAMVMLIPFLRTRGKDWKYERPATWLLGWEASVFVLCLVAGCVALMAFAPPWVPQAIGTVAVVNIFILVLAVVISSLVLIRDQTGIPVITLLIIWALLLAAFDVNDNHVVTLVEQEHREKVQPSQLSTDSRFKAWAASRKDRDHYKDEPYPVFIVAAGGGGAYAAHYTASFLARLQDRCPNFAQHVFAISGVSGGSLGASVFASLARHEAKNGGHEPCDFSGTDASAVKGPFETRTQKFFEKDFLAPVVAAALFPDLLQRLLPWSISRFDRSKALDASFEFAWRDAMADEGAAPKANPFSKAFLDLWPSDDYGAVPSLVFNTTEVANGYSIVISPFDPDQGVDQKWSKSDYLHRRLPDSRDGPVKLDVKLSTAAGISARFPWILPAATVNTELAGGRKSRMRLVDGGYVESSAVETASQMLRGLRYKYGRSQFTSEFKFYLIVLIGYEGLEAEEQSYGEATIPAQTLVSSWQSRGELSFMRAIEDACPGGDFGRCHLFQPPIDPQPDKPVTAADLRASVEAPIEPVLLNLRDFNVPLAWQLSRAHRAIIGLHAGHAHRCRQGNMRRIGWPTYALFDHLRRRDAAKPDESHDSAAPDEPHDAATEIRFRMRQALGENNCSACMVQYKLADKSQTPAWDADDTLICAEPGAAPAEPPSGATSSVP